MATAPNLPTQAQYKVTFDFLVGPGAVELPTPDLVVMKHVELKAAGASNIIIRDKSGQIRSIEEIAAIVGEPPLR
jgi:hypothetical protein